MPKCEARHTRLSLTTDRFCGATAERRRPNSPRRAILSGAATGTALGWRKHLSGGQTMKRSTERILTTHVGSLPRPPDLLEMIQAKERGEAFDGDAFASRVGSAVADV